MTAVLLGGLAAVDYVTGYLPIAQTDESRQAALAAAEAGVDDYVNRLNEDPNYWNDGSDASNVAMQGGGIPGGSVPNTGPWGWVPVAPGSSADFHYYVDTSDMTSYKETDSATASWGTIYITSTGKVGTVTRTIEVGVRQADFLSNLYLSNYNLVDPIMEADSGAMSLANAQACVVYGWAANGAGQNGYGPSPGGCWTMFNYWISGNVVNGPMQANDDYYICGDPQFDDSVTSADPSPADSPYWLDHACVGAGQFPHAQYGGRGLHGGRQRQRDGRHVPEDGALPGQRLVHRGLYLDDGQRQPGLPLLRAHLDHFLRQPDAGLQPGHALFQYQLPGGHPLDLVAPARQRGDLRRQPAVQPGRQPHYLPGGLADLGRTWPPSPGRIAWAMPSWRARWTGR